jgi:hypothetical protein
MCDRENLPLLDFESYILTYGGNKWVIQIYHTRKC